MAATARRTHLSPAHAAARSLRDWRARYHASQHRHARVVVAVQLSYGALLAAFLLYTHSWPAPDLIALFLLGFALVAARGLAFLRDWTPFVLLLLGYIALTGIVPGLEARAHVAFPIAADGTMFGGHVPTLWLQAHFYHADEARWYDYGATLMYPMHFVVPLVVAFVFWMWRPRYFRRFVAAYLLLCYAGFLTYIVFPMAPPWWAYRVGELPPVHLVLYEVHYGGVSNPIVLAARLFQPNPVAAMPSLHAAVPFLVFLVLWRAWPRRGWLAVLYPLAMSVAVVYMGEHYVIDVLAGWVYALVAFAIVLGAHEGGRRVRNRAGTINHERFPVPAIATAAPLTIERRS